VPRVTTWPSPLAGQAQYTVCGDEKKDSFSIMTKVRQFVPATTVATCVMCCCSMAA